MSRKKHSTLENNGVIGIKLSLIASGTDSPRKNPIKRVGQTGNFLVDYDSTERLILVYGKEVPTSHKFKLGLDRSETTALINLLKRAKTLFDN